MQQTNITHKKEEEGFILVVCLLVLVLLTIVGIAATTTTDIELQTALSDSLYKRNFYRAEAACAEGIEYATSPSVTRINDLDKLEDMRIAANWTNANSNTSQLLTGEAGTSRYAIVGPEIVAGESEGMSKQSVLQEYYILGLYQKPDKSQVIVEAGFRVRQ